MWRAIPSSSVPSDLRGVQPLGVEGLIDEQLHHAQLVHRHARDPPEQDLDALVELLRRGRLDREAPLQRLGAGQGVAREQQALGALGPSRCAHIAVVGEPHTRAGG